MSILPFFDHGKPIGILKFMIGYIKKIGKTEAKTFFRIAAILNLGNLGKIQNGSCPKNAVCLQMLNQIRYK